LKVRVYTASLFSAAMVDPQLLDPILLEIANFSGAAASYGLTMYGSFLVN